MMLGDPGFRPPLSHQVGYQPYIGSVPLAAPGLGAAMQGIAQALGVGSSTARSRQGMPVSRRKPPARPLQPGLLGPILDELQAKSAINRIREGEWDQRPLPVFGAWPQSQAPGQPPASWHDDPMAALMQGIEHALHGGNSIDRGRAQSQTQFQTRAEGNASVQPWATEWNRPTDLAQTPNAWQSVPMQPTPETQPPLRLGLLGPILDDLEAEALRNAAFTGMKFNPSTTQEWDSGNGDTVSGIVMVSGSGEHQPSLRQHDAVSPRSLSEKSTTLPSGRSIGIPDFDRRLKFKAADPFEGRKFHNGPRGKLAGESRRSESPSQVLISEPVGFGRSSFGHASVDIDGESYSFGPYGMHVSPSSEYIERNNFRDGLGLILKLTDEEKNRLAACLKRPQGSYSWARNNCTDPIERCLAEAGYNVGDSWTPDGLGGSVLESPELVSYSKQYPASTVPSVWRAPWAK